VDNALFTTLSTTTRLIEFSKRRFLLTDTVGFIDRLPLTLIEAFLSTLEETIYSDLIIVVLDISEPLETIRKKNRTCQKTIDQIGASGVPVITALNKIDCLTEEEAQQKLQALKDETKNPLLLSAKAHTNFNQLRQAILKRLEEYVEADFSVPMTVATMSLVSWVHKGADVKKIDYTDNAVQVQLEANPEFAEKLRKRVQDMQGKIEIKPKPP
jgi:GTP-binding protein HflX